MLSIDAVHFDDFIPNWRTQTETLQVNVLALVTEGKVCYRINGEPHVGERGDFIFIPRSARRAGDNHPAGPHQKYTVLFRSEGDALAGIPFLEERRFAQFRISGFPYVQSRFERLYEEFRNGGRFRPLVCEGILQELLGVLAGELERPEVAPMKAKYAQQLKRYLLEHYREPVEIGQLARLIRRSPNYTISVFREVIGYTPIQYMHRLRMMEACDLLASTDMTVAGIAGHLGYYDTSYFFRMFKKHTAMSPTDFMLRGRPHGGAEPFA